MPENYTLSDKINVMMAKKKDAEIMVRPHNGNEQWTTIENPDFNWGVADYKVKPDYKLLFDKFQAAFVYDELYAAVHAQERGQNLPNIINELSNQLATYKTSLLNKVENELLVGTSPLLSLTEFKKSIPGKTLAGILQKKLELEGKSKEEIETELEKGLITYLTELNSVIKTNPSTIRSSIKDQLALTLDKQILDIKALEENDLIKKEYTTKNKLKSIIINLFLEAVEKFFKDETEKYIFCKNGNFGITITRNTDKNNPTIQFFYLAYNKIDGFNDVPAIDWTLNADKVVTVSNITVQQLKDLQNSVDESKHICKTNYDNLKARVDLEIQNNIAKSEKIKELEQEITKLKESDNELLKKVYQKMPLNPVCAYDMADVQYTDVTQNDLKDFSYTFSTGADYAIYNETAVHALKNGHRYRITADFEILQGDTKHAFLCYYDFDGGGQWGGSLYQSLTPVVNGKCKCVLDFVCKNTDLQGHRLHILFYNGQNGHILPNAISKWSNFRIETISDTQVLDASGSGNHANIANDVEKAKDDKIGTVLKCNKGYLTRPAQDFIGVGKQWSHSRWLKIDIDQILGKQHSQGEDENDLEFVWNYGKVDNATLDIGQYDSGWPPDEYGYFSINSKEGNNNYIKYFGTEEFEHDKWYHLVVMTDLQPTYCEKIVFINGVKRGQYKKESTFNSSDINDKWIEYSNIEGSIANLIFFDRLLTDFEVLWLYKNPVYPIKNYTLADAKLNKKLISFYKNGYVQWPGMPSPLEDDDLHFDGYSWHKVNYDGNFFRAEGRNSKTFSTKKLTKENIKNNSYIFQDDEQVDAIRNIKGRVGIEGGVNPSGPFYNETPSTAGVESWQTTSSNYTVEAINLDLSRVTSVADENRPRNLTFAIWVLVKD